MREASELAPKPMIPIGNRPILWHVMKYYAHFGLHRLRAVPRLQGRGRSRSSSSPTTRRWRTTSCSPTAGRRSTCSRPTSTTGTSRSSTPACTPRSASGCARCASCSRRRDVPRQLRRHAHRRADERPRRRVRATDAVASLLAIRPPGSFHVVDVRRRADLVTGFRRLADLTLRINGGFFVLRNGDLRLSQRG